MLIKTILKAMQEEHDVLIAASRKTPSVRQGLMLERRAEYLGMGISIGKRMVNRLELEAAKQKKATSKKPR
jgi:hypothetical protein